MAVQPAMTHVALLLISMTFGFNFLFTDSPSGAPPTEIFLANGLYNCTRTGTYRITGWGGGQGGNDPGGKGSTGAGGTGADCVTSEVGLTDGDGYAVVIGGGGNTGLGPGGDTTMATNADPFSTNPGSILAGSTVHNGGLGGLPSAVFDVGGGGGGAAGSSGNGSNGADADTTVGGAPVNGGNGGTGPDADHEGGDGGRSAGVTGGFHALDGQVPGGGGGGACVSLPVPGHGGAGKLIVQFVP